MVVASTQCKRWRPRLGLGLDAVLGSGRQPAPWIHLADAVGLVRFAMADQYLQGPVIAVAAEAVTQATFAQALAASFGWVYRGCLCVLHLGKCPRCGARLPVGASAAE